MIQLPLTLQQLFEFGFGYLPINQQLLTSAISGASLLLQSKADTWEEWAFTSPVTGSNIGLLEGNRLSYTHELPFLTASVGVRADAHAIQCLQAVEVFYRHLRNVATDLCALIGTHTSTPELASRIRPSFESAKVAPPTNLLIGVRSGAWRRQRDFVQDTGLLTFIHSETPLFVKDKIGKKRFATPPAGSMLVVAGQKISQLQNEPPPSLTYSIADTEGPVIVVTVELKPEDEPAAIVADNVASLFK